MSALLSLVAAACFAAPQLPTATDHDPEQQPAGRESFLGREIAQTMHWSGASWLMRKTREDEENGALLRKWLAVQPGQAVCDFGCGSGYHTVPLAEAVGATGELYAVDLQPQMLTLLRQRCEPRGLNHVTYIEAAIDDPKLAPASCDLILLVDVYHELSHPVRVMDLLRQALKPNGRVVLVEFRKEDREVPIKPDHTMSKAQVVREMAMHGYALQEQFDGLPWQHAMSFVPSPERGRRFQAQQLLQAFLVEAAAESTLGRGQRLAPFLASGVAANDLPDLGRDLRSELRFDQDAQLIAELCRANGAALPGGKDQVVLRQDQEHRWQIHTIRARDQAAYAHGSSRPFVAMHTALGRGTIQQRLDLIREHQFDGVAWSFEQLAAVRAACDARSINMWSAYTVLELGDGVEQRLAPIYDGLTALSGGPGMLWLGLRQEQRKPRDPAGDEAAARVLRTLLEKADQLGVEIALYPHFGFWMETIEDAQRLCDRVQHARLGVCFNLCHFLRNHTETDPRAALRACGSSLLAVTIHGALSTGETWQQLIQPLSQGDFELGAFLDTLHAMQFRGPVGLQAYGIQEPPSEHLPVSAAAWRNALKR
jgi:ubiquinone/menaquinone biosynthesis C-methylase UbiE/sugar phosphate isomerase/epimerase